jgi:hypothetical protein
MPLTSIGFTIENRLKIVGLGSKSLGLHLLEFIAAGVAEVSQQIDCAIDRHFAQLDETLVRLQISVQDFSGDFFGSTAAPARAASAEMIETFTGATPNQLRHPVMSGLRLRRGRPRHFGNQS